LDTSTRQRNPSLAVLVCLVSLGWNVNSPLALFTWGWGAEYILDFSQAPDGEPNDLNHTESQFVLQTGDDVEVRLREPNGCGFELLIPHHSCFFIQLYKLPVIAEEQ
jgi:hypothetical protein